MSGTVVVYAVALFYVGLSIRADARLTKRWRETATELEARLGKLERRHDRERRRRVQLEAVLRAAGMELPPWPICDDEGDDDDEPATPARRAPVIQLPRRVRS